MRYFLIFFILVLLVNCSSVPKEYLINDDVCHYNYPIFNITKEELLIDEKILNLLQKEKRSIVTVDGDDYKNEYWYSKDEITNKQTNKVTNINKYLYYNNKGKIIFSAFTYNNIYNLGKETDYDEQGNITKVIDYEKGYNICWAEAIAIVKKIAKKEIEKYEITEFYAVHNNLNEFPEVKPIWYIGLLKGNENYKNEVNKKGTLRFRIDGITGKVLKKYRIQSGF
ncbi:hypothetical protein Q4517_03305 [Tenacibaculum sp. 1_MG-2023]|uniref:hypothetical protein n=1 Tax=Tenacibaculum sp. 1_MG-2023 TaxID=3062653 RepID=UPI0026E175F7|nr:hypothetical protein [Tenacibaculum sp. 1_MG-2023]MDO6674573.1 hypothetical protein [Tenacibaculum sp. 1_MG-2023]